uniref:MARVEL domain-containing protein n=2 Tax=Spongospora subterranea TaxID=70186 RepID=A0A0H5QZK7_9EUKA|eukprot:CRZ01004.1 hypothetical protein [Spongospora subterranea]
MVSASVFNIPERISSIEWTRLNQLRAAWGFTLVMCMALIISALAAAASVHSATMQFSLVWYMITLTVWSAFSCVVLLISVPWIQMDPSIAFGALVASTSFLATVTLSEGVRWASVASNSSVTSVAVFSVLTTVCLIVTLVGFVQFKDDLLGDSGTMEAPNVVSPVPSQQGQSKQKGYYDQSMAERA